MYVYMYASCVVCVTAFVYGNTGIVVKERRARVKISHKHFY